MTSPWRRPDPANRGRRVASQRRPRLFHDAHTYGLPTVPIRPTRRQRRRRPSPIRFCYYVLAYLCRLVPVSRSSSLRRTYQCFALLTTVYVFVPRRPRFRLKCNPRDASNGLFRLGRRPPFPMHDDCTMSNFYNKVSLAYTKPMVKRTTLQEISQANQWINGEHTPG